MSLFKPTQHQKARAEKATFDGDYVAVCRNSQGPCGWTQKCGSALEAFHAETDHIPDCYDPENACTHPSGCFCEACDD